MGGNEERVELRRSGRDETELETSKRKTDIAAAIAGCSEADMDAHLSIFGISSPCAGHV